MDMPLPVIAGVLSTTLFVASMLPMLIKAMRTRDLRSYSPAMLLLANTGNIMHSVYVFSLPFGPIWVLHTFHLTSMALMLLWYLRYEWLPARSPRRRDADRAGEHRVTSASASPA